MELFMYIRFFGLLLLSLAVYAIIMQAEVTPAKTVLAVVFSLALAAPLSFVPPLYELIFVFSVLAFVALTARVKTSLMVTAVIVSIGISLGLEILAQFAMMPVMIAIGVIVLYYQMNVNDIPETAITPETVEQYFYIPPVVVAVIALAISALVVWRLSKSKRLRNGFDFLESREARWIGIIFCLIIMAFRSFGAVLQERAATLNDAATVTIFILAIISICTIGVHFWWRHDTTMLYQQRIKDRDLQVYLSEIEQRDRQIQELSESNEQLAAAVHSDNKLISALHLAVNDFLTSPELAAAGLDAEGRRLSSQLAEIMAERQRQASLTAARSEQPPATGLERIDYIIRYLSAEAARQSVSFDLVVMEGLDALAEATISTQGLEVLVADLVENAIAATLPCPVKKVLVSMGTVDGCYEIAISDSGIPFELSTLAKLGKERSTTRADQGGSGLGYLAVFAALAESQASLCINESHSEQGVYSKAVKVRFDGKQGLTIQTNRSDELAALLQAEQRDGVTVLHLG